MTITRNGLTIILTNSELHEAYLEETSHNLQVEIGMAIAPYKKTEKLNASDWETVEKIAFKRYQHMNTNSLSVSQKIVACIEDAIMIIRDWPKDEVVISDLSTNIA